MPASSLRRSRVPASSRTPRHDETIRAAFFNQNTPNWQIVIPSFGTVTGPFKVTALHYEGPYDGELKLSLTLASAGALTFAAA